MLRMLLPILISSAVILLIVGRFGVQARRRRADAHIERFGSPMDRDRDVDRAAAWFRGRRDAGLAGGAVDDRTWNDLDMDAVWAALDRTASQIGAQVLYDRLRRPGAHIGDVPAFDAAVQRLGSDANVRARVTRELLRLDGWHVGSLASLLWDPVPPPLPMQALCVALSVATLAAIGAMFVWPKALLAVMALLFVSMFLRSALRNRLDPYVPALHAIPEFMSALQRIASVDDPVLAPWTGVLREHQEAFRPLQAAARWVSMEAIAGGMGMDSAAEIANAAREYINFTFLLDVNAFNRSVVHIRRHQAALRMALEALGTIDAMVAVASVRRQWGGQWCRPLIGHELRQLHGAGLRHPLLTDAVPNDFVALGASWLVTGSNMSGKSTFLRTVGVNALLAGTIHTVRGTRWEGPPFGVRSCIGRSDSLMEGKSYYLAEVEAVRDLLAVSARDEPTIFILDELFRGTNTVERVAAARAVLEALDTSPHLVVVATHDVELLHWLASRYDAWHFREQVDGDALRFDYRLRPGASSTRNALAILRLKGFPESVVRLAEATVMEVEDRRSDG